MGSDDLTPSKSRLLNRRPPHELEGLQEAAINVLQHLHGQGKLQALGAWRNEDGDLVQSWPEDGDVLECYMDMLGLNNRPIVEYSSLDKAKQRASRRRALAARD